MALLHLQFVAVMAERAPGVLEFALDYREKQKALQLVCNQSFVHTIELNYVV